MVMIENNQVNPWFQIYPHQCANENYSYGM